MDSGVYEFLPQDRVIWGRRTVEAVCDEADRLAAGRVFLVASGTLNRQTALVSDLRRALGRRCVGVFDETREHAPRPTVIQALGAVRAAEPDLIVSLGGGTVIDTVKVVLIGLAAGVTREVELDACRVALREDGSLYVPDFGPPPCRQIAVPTTLSGAEHSSLGASLDTDRSTKDGYSAPESAPVSVILDPEATHATPDWLWLSTGLRAVDHAVESLCSIAPVPLVDACAEHALALLQEGLRRSRRTPQDPEARLACLQGAWLAATGIGRVPYGASHGIGHVLGAVAGVSHGYTSCVMLPAVLAYNRSHTAARQVPIARALGRDDGDASRAVAALVEDLGMPASLEAVGVPEEQLDVIAEAALANTFVRGNPRPLETAADVRELLELARA